MIFKVKKNFIMPILFLITIIQASKIPKFEKDKSFNFQNVNLRSLLEETKVEEICLRADSDVKDFFDTGNNQLSEMDYEDDSEYIQDLLNIIDGKGDKSKGDSIKSYIKRLLPMAIFIVFGVVAIILWPICICCLCCCKCCCCFCCCGKVNKLWKTIFFFLSGGAFVLTFVMATYGLAATNNVFQGIDSTSCTIFKVVTETVNGQSKTTLPKWGGINGIKQKLSDLSSLLETERTTSVQNFNSAKGQMQTSKGEFDYLLAHTSMSITNRAVIDPITNSEIQFTPEYIKYYSPVETPGTMLFQINTEYTGLTSAIIETINDASSHIDNSFTSSSLSTQLNEASEKIDKMKDAFDKLETDVADQWMKIQNNYINNAKTYAKIVFSIIMVLSLGMTGIYVIMFIDVCSTLQTLLKLITTILWNLLYLFSILSYIISGLIGVIAIIGKDGSSLAYYLVSDENLNSEDPRVFGASDSIDYLKICVNGNGDLTDILGIGDEMNDLNDLLALKDTLNTHKTTLNTHRESVVINNFKSKNCGEKFLNTGCNYIRTDVNPNVRYDFNKWLDHLNKCTSKIEGNYQTGSFNYDELWGTTSSSRDGYTYQPVSSDQAQQNSKKLLNIYDGWTKTIVESRYNTPGTLEIDSSSTTVRAEAGQVIDEMGKVKSGVASDYSTVDTKNQEINGKFTEVADNMIITLEKSINIIDSVNNIIVDFLGEGNHNIFSIIHCSFIGDDFKFLMKQLHSNIGNTVYSFASAMISMTAFLSLALYSSIFYMVLVKKVHDINQEKNE